MSDQAEPNRLVWDSEAQFPDLSDTLREALRQVKDPEIGLDIIQLGLIRNVTIEPDHVMLKMLLTTPYCPYGPAMLETTRQKAEEALGRPAHIDLSMDMWDFSMMEDGLGNEWGLYS